MNAKFFGALLAAPLAAASAMIMAAPASAAVFFNNGDVLNFSGGYKSTLSVGKFEFRNVGGTSFAGIGSYGNFGILGAESTGDFSLFDSNNAVVDGNKILSVDFNDSTTYLGKDFLKVTKGADSFTFVITGHADPALAPGRTSRAGTNYLGDVSLIGNFVSSSGSVFGSGILTNNFVKRSNNSLTPGSYSSTLTVTKVTVPEPSALLGLGLMVGTVFIIRRRQEVPA